MTMSVVDLRTEAAAEVRRLTRARALIRDGDERALAQLEGDTTWIALPRRSRLRRSLGRRVCLVWRAAFEDASGRLVESRLVPILIDAGRVLLGPAQKRREWIQSLLRQADGPVRVRVEAECEEWRAAVTRVRGASTSARLSRERDIAAHRAASSPAAQPGLFDRRAEHSRQARAAAVDESAHAALERTRAIDAGGTIALVPARLLLVIVP